MTRKLNIDGYSLTPRFPDYVVLNNNYVVCHDNSPRGLPPVPSKDEAERILKGSELEHAEFIPPLP